MQGHKLAASNSDFARAERDVIDSEVCWRAFWFAIFVLNQRPQIAVSRIDARTDGRSDDETVRDFT